MWWQPHELVFLARGRGPWLLAWANAQAAAAAAPVDRLLTDTGTALHVAAARVGDPVKLGGPRRLQAPAAPIPWTRVLLWLVLLAGVLALGFMARAAWRERPPD